jgi:hypothetical protein
MTIYLKKCTHRTGFVARSFLACARSYFPKLALKKKKKKRRGEGKRKKETKCNLTSNCESATHVTIIQVKK